MPLHRLRAVLAMTVLLPLAACTLGSGATLPTSGSATLAAHPSSVVNEPQATAAGALPPELPGVVAPRCVNATPGWFERELASPGQRVQLPRGRSAVQADEPAVQGYLDRTYAACGEHLGVHLAATTPTRVVVEAIRVGDYHGFRGRLVWRSAPVAVGRHPHLPMPAHVTQDNAWPTTLDVMPTATWSPGLYVIRFHDLDKGAADTYQPLYVLTSGQHAAYLAIGSDLTQLAYNQAGGRSLYFGDGSTKESQRLHRAYVASTHRALLTTGGGALFAMDVPLAVLLARHHITADWTSDMSLDADPTQLNGYATAILPGHSEYWTRRNYDTLSIAVGHGTNLAVLGANEIYWQPRLQRDSLGNVTSMTVYRLKALDPTTVQTDKTTEWRDAPLSRDPASLTGLGMSGVGIQGDGVVQSTPAWLFKGTGLKVGSVLPRLYGNEGDGPLDPHAPPNTQILLRSNAQLPNHKTVVVATAYYSAPSGAGVFNAGTTEWVCGITDLCTEPPRSTQVRRAADQITANLLAAFARPRAGLRYPSKAGA
ncbi:hypothetical protein BJ986_002850 [Phycicoccus badiiscoriae]|uniref:N,N-dimethylformamidase beta subunit-like C-terminal domain-containing protein n=1 Tax=Pedococcus badiiscoriae TaxID=642776 RepID=A0A852WGH9_9MICO|nr:N,N-dimethylformamidase beta subunit family domain-containing protein [Pedococcus badiiscoriae]NYG08363.1 hypothetical protein [Pedococcus badiiscoriae]